MPEERMTILKIAVADDEPDTREYLQKLLPTAATT
jgi:CheY-like chemotaxis protein